MQPKAGKHLVALQCALWCWSNRSVHGVYVMICAETGRWQREHVWAKGLLRGNVKGSWAGGWLASSQRCGRAEESEVIGGHQRVHRCVRDLPGVASHGYAFCRCMLL
jgi:hypothetical protein